MTRGYIDNYNFVKKPPINLTRTGIKHFKHSLQSSQITAYEVDESYTEHKAGKYGEDTSNACNTEPNIEITLIIITFTNTRKLLFLNIIKNLRTSPHPASVITELYIHATVTNYNKKM